MNENIDEIICSILNKTASEDQKQTFKRWRDENHLNEETFDMIKKFWDIKTHEVEIINEDDVKNKIWDKAQKKKKLISPIRNLIRYAAVISFIVLSIFIVNNLFNSTQRNVEQVRLEIIEKKNLSGMKSMIHLPDGSVVNLNSKSSIKYIRGFKDTVRWVLLDGEAFFSVASNKNKPFIVKSQNIYTEAIGTAFNIHTRKEKASVQVSLTEGMVSVHPKIEGSQGKRILLEPGQSVLYENSEVVDIKEFDYDKTIGWKDGIILFENAGFITVKNKLEKWYGVKIEVSNPVPIWNLDAKFHNASLEQILKALSHSEGFEYQLIEEKVIITIR
ncbi:MAG: FecR domain-containing protein [Cytophagales bacterium]|nr:FecR domain-containing protein [Cytophagales bacterium]